MHEDAPPPGLRRLDRHFRWRGSEVSRLEALTDTVFAIVLGLLFLRSAPPQSYGELADAMKSLIPFAVTFAIIAYIWVEHWLFARRYDLQDPGTTFLNLLLLFLLLFYAYPLKFLFTLLSIALFGPIGGLDVAHVMQGYEHVGIDGLFMIYGIGYGSIFFVIALMYARALRFAEALALDPVERFLTKSGIVQSSIQGCVGILSAAIAAAGIGVKSAVPGWMYIAIGPLMALHGVWEGRCVRRLQEGAAQARSLASSP